MVVVGAMCLVIVGNRDHLNVVMTHLVSKSAVLNWSSFSALNPTKYICIYIFIHHCRSQSSAGVQITVSVLVVRASDIPEASIIE